MAISRADSHYQTFIEEKAKKWFIKQKNLTEDFETKLSIDGSIIKTDLKCRDKDGKLVLGEIFTRNEPFKAGQKRKLGMDILKLVSYRRSIKDESIKLVIILNELAYDYFINSESWLRESTKLWEIQIEKYELEPDDKQELKLVTKNQARGNIGQS